MSSGWIVWPFGIMSLLVVSLVVYGALTTAGPPRPGLGGVFGAPTFSPQPSGLPSGSGTPTASGSPTASGRPTTFDTVAPTPGTVDGGIAVPTAGAYTVHVDGTEGVKFTAFGFCNRTFPTTATLYIKDHYTGRDGPTSYEFDIAYSTLHSERHIYEYTRTAVFLEYEFAQVSCAGNAQPSEVRYSPFQEKVRLPLRVGASWSGSGGDAQRTETYTSKVTGTQTLAIAGRSIPTFVIETSVKMTGSEHGTRFQRWWYSPAYALPLRWHEEINAARGPATYRDSLTVTFTDLDPR